MLRYLNTALPMNTLTVLDKSLFAASTEGRTSGTICYIKAPDNVRIEIQQYAREP